MADLGVSEKDQKFTIWDKWELALCFSNKYSLK
jgi:hypothetical protein